uniref:DNA translocase FtsK n=1 Tax=Chitinolyticbacter albus TaxID=2961951 RepID=UPI002109D0B0
MLQPAQPRNSFHRALFWGALAVIAIVMTAPGRHAPLRALLGLPAWLLIAALLQRGWHAWRASRVPRIAASQWGGIVLLGAGLAIGEYLLQGSRPLLGAWLTFNALPNAAAGLLALAVGIAVGLPLWARRGWGAVFECAGELLEHGWEARHGWRERLRQTDAPAAADIDSVDSRQQPTLSDFAIDGGFALRDIDTDDLPATIPPALEIARPASVETDTAVVAPAEHAWQLSPRRTLPKIELPQLMENLQRVARTRPAAPAQVQSTALPVIDSAEIRARLREIHGERLAPAPRPIAPAQPKPAQPVAKTVIRHTAKAAAAASKPVASAPASETSTANSTPPVAPLPVMPAAAAVVMHAPITLGIEPDPGVLADDLLIELPEHAPSTAPIPQAPPSLSWPQLDAGQLQHVPVFTGILERGLETAETATTPAPAQPAPVMPAPWLTEFDEEIIAPALPDAAVDDVAPWAAELIARRAAPPVPAAPRPAPRHYDDSMLPPVSLLQPATVGGVSLSDEELIERGILIEERLAEFKVKVRVLDAYAGPVITRYEIEPAVGVRGAQVVNLMKDLARALGLVSIRVVETIPGKTCMGMELPNPTRQMIRLSEILAAEEFAHSASKLTMALGKDITGKPIVTDLAKAPHMLVAGTTGSGKSVGVNAMILSLL